MKVLGIETSCDDTASAVVDSDHGVLSSLVSSQLSTHAKFGGVVPEVAAREHLEHIDFIVRSSLSEANVSLKDLDAIAITQGPGLIGSLLIGICYAKGLATSSGIRLIPVDHVHAHVHGAFLSAQIKNETIQFPCAAFVVSGGHCNLYYMENPLDFQLMAVTIDDACGESFDKVAKLMGFTYPGGPIIEKLAQKGDANRFPMPRMIEEKSRLAFSYSGLKTHVVNQIRKLKTELSDQDRYDLAASFQEAALDQLVRKIESLRKIKPNTKSVVIAGGVAANSRLKEMITSRIKIPFHAPDLRFCSDNGAMIAAYGQALLIDNIASQTDEWDAYSRYNFSEYLT